MLGSSAFASRTAKVAALVLLQTGCGQSTNPQYEPRSVLGSDPRWILFHKEESWKFPIASRVLQISKSGKNIATGFRVGNPPKIIVTAGHVAAVVKLASPRGEGEATNGQFTFEIHSKPVIDPLHDLAYWTLSDDQKEIVKELPPMATGNASDGAPIYVYGFDPGRQELLISPGHLSKQSDLETATADLQYDVDTLPGFSGGPIVSDSNAWLGIHTGNSGPVNRGSKVQWMDDLLSK